MTIDSPEPLTRVMDTGLDHLARVRLMQSVLSSQGPVSALVVSPENVRYLCGYRGFTQSPRALFVPMSGEPVLIVVADDKDLALSLCSFEIRTYPLASNRFEVMIETCSSLLRSIEGANDFLGLEFDALTVPQFEVCRRLLQQFRFRDLSSDITHFRMIKDQFEIVRYRRAAEIAVIAAAQGIKAFNPGASEIDVKSTIEQVAFSECARRWPDSVIESEVNVVSGPKMSRLHDFATGRQIRAGEMGFFIEGIACDGYWANLARTVPAPTGGQPSHLQSLSDRATDAQHAAFEHLGPGLTLADASRAADKRLEQYGLHARRVYPMFRGLGLSKYERPGLQDLDRPLQSGMCFCVQVYIEAEGAIVGRTDSVLITDSRAEVLTSSGM